MSENTQQFIDSDGSDIWERSTLSIQDDGTVSGSAVTSLFESEYQAEIIITTDKDEIDGDPSPDQLSYTPNVIVTEANGIRVCAPEIREFDTPEGAIEKAIDVVEHIIDTPEEYIPENPNRSPSFVP